MSTFEEAEKFLKFLVASFLVKPIVSKDIYLHGRKTHSMSDDGGRNLVGGIRLKSITIYPVKSCAGFSVNSWPLTHMGLMHDREWLLRGPSGDILTQKKVPKMCHIHTSIDLGLGKLFVESPHSTTRLQICLQKNLSCSSKEEMEVYGQRYEVQNYGSEVNMWFSEALGRPCTFVRCLASENDCRLDRGSKGRQCRDINSKLNFANEAQLLLLSESSINDLNCRLRSNKQTSNSTSEKPAFVDAMRFRPNLVISGAEPFAEDNWKTLHIAKENFVSLGGCNRCQMINIDQETGQMLNSREPLATLASYRRVQGKILFGVLLRYENANKEKAEGRSDEERWLKVGQEVYPS